MMRWSAGAQEKSDGEERKTGGRAKAKSIGGRGEEIWVPSCKLTAPNLHQSMSSWTWIIILIYF